MIRCDIIAALSIAVSTAFFCAGAQAAAILNMSDKRVGFEINNGDGYELIIVEPKNNYRTPGSMRVKNGGEEIFIDHDEEYTFWPNGDFASQKRIKRKH